MLANATTGSCDTSGTEHIVRFYDRDEQLLDEVGEFLDEALRAGGLAVAIATAEHRSELARKLSGLGPLRGALSAWHSGRLVMVDAAEFLKRFMAGLRPDPDRFESALRPIWESAPAGKPVHAFGEMVSLLCASGNFDGALALEALWDEQVRRRRFSLFCGYPWRLFSSNEQVRAFQQVCAAHGRVLPGAGRSDVAMADPARSLLELEQQERALQTEVQRRLEAEHTLRHRERDLADFLDNASEGIHKVAHDGTILYANRAELEMLGYRREEYVGRNIVDFYVDRRQIEGILSRLKLGQVLRDEPALLLCKDGSHKPVLICSNGYFENAELVYTRCFTRDASERVARDRALKQRNDVILHAPVGAALLVGQELHFELANDAWVRMLGREIVGKAFSQALPELTETPLDRALRHVLETAEPFTADEFPMPFGSGESPKYYKVALQPLQGVAGEAQAIVAIAADVTEQVCARRTLEQSAVERETLLGDLREASRAKDEFLAMLGHELRNPLSPIMTALQLMRMRGETGTEREQAIIQRQVEHLARLVDDLLDVSRITRGQIQLKVERCDIATILTKAVEQASTLLQQRSHRLQVDVAPGLYCECDPIRLSQVVANLLTNAARYTQKCGEICLRAWRESHAWLVISVRDNGQGMAAETLAKVFELFYQSKRGVDRAEGGLGVGLAIVHSLVSLHGGSVEARSDGLGKGSEFVVRLAALTEPGSTDVPTVAIDEKPVGRRILLVDDHVDGVEVMGELLRGLGHTVSVFTDPASALQALPALRPEVALLDIGLPVMDGYELAARIRVICGESCMLVALTGYGQENDKTRARAAGFDCHIVKPISYDQLSSILRPAIGGVASPRVAPGV